MLKLKDNPIRPLSETPSSYVLIPQLPKDEYFIEISSGNTYSTIIGETLTLPLKLELPARFKKDLTPFVVYTAYLDRNNWEQINSVYISGKTLELSLEIDTNMLDLPAGTYTFVVGLFPSTNFVAGSSLTEQIFTITLREDEDNSNYLYTIRGEIYDKNATELNITNATNASIKKLLNFKSLTRLQISGETITDISPLVSIPTLKELSIFSTSLKNIEPLKDMLQLTHLCLGGIEFNGPSISGELYDISAISNLINLQTLTIKDCEVSNIDAIRNLKNLNMLWIYKTQVSDITPISGLTNLTDLRIHYNNIKDISCLSHLENLTFLAVSYNSFPTEQVDELQAKLVNCEIINN